MDASTELTILTKRLQLHPFRPEDLDIFVQLNTDPFIRKYLWDDQVISEATARDILMRNSKYFKNDRHGIWKILLQNTDKIIGFTGLWHFFDEDQPQLIYSLLKPYTKKGYAIEAGKAIINYAFNKLDFEYLIAATDEPHEESKSVALRLGMKFVKKRIEDGKPTCFFKIENQSQRLNDPSLST